MQPLISIAGRRKGKNVANEHQAGQRRQLDIALASDVTKALHRKNADELIIAVTDFMETFELAASAHLVDLIPKQVTKRYAS